jgi:hypothetical protein
MGVAGDMFELQRDYEEAAACSPQVREQRDVLCTMCLPVKALLL